MGALGVGIVGIGFRFGLGRRVKRLRKLVPVEEGVAVIPGDVFMLGIIEARPVEPSPVAQ